MVVPVTLLRVIVFASVVTASSLMPAFATPPDIVDIQDELLGVGETHIAILRTAYDNRGLYDTEIGTVFLRVVDRSTGAEELHRVFRSLTMPESNNGTDLQLTIQPQALSNAVEPFTFMAENGIHPLSMTRFGNIGAQAAVRPDGRLSLSDPQGTVFSAPWPEVLAGVTTSLDQMADLWPEDGQRMSPIQTTDLLRGRALTDAECKPTTSLMVRGDADVAPIALLRLECSDGDGQRTSALIALPRTGAAQ